MWDNLIIKLIFFRARYGENRSIFNTPNARLMNVSLLRDNNKLLHAQERRGSKVSQRAPSRQPSMGSLRAHSPNGSHPGAKNTQRVNRTGFYIKIQLLSKQLTIVYN